MASRILTSARRFESLAYRILRHKSTSVVLSETDLQLLNKYNKSPILSDVLKSFQCFASQAPKGFEKFFKDKPKPGPKKRAEKSSSKKEKDASEAPAARSSSQGSQKGSSNKDISDFFKLNPGGGGKKGAGSGGGGYGNMSDPDKQKVLGMLATGVAVVLGMVALNEMRYR